MNSKPDPAKVEALIAARIAARNAKDFAESDRLRAEIVAMGVILMDAKDPDTGEFSSTWRPAGMHHQGPKPINDSRLGHESKPISETKSDAEGKP